MRKRTQERIAWKYERPEDMSKSARILFVGDIVGGLGKRTLLGLLPDLRERLRADVHRRQR